MRSDRIVPAVVARPTARGGTPRRICLMLVAVVALGCERDTPVAPALHSPLAEIVDGGSGGKSYFYFLAPIVRPAPHPIGELDAGLLPDLEVTVCALHAGQCATTLTTFSAEGQGPARLRIEDDEQPHFHVNWQTGAHQLDPGTNYRITVLAAGTELGHADVDVVSHPR